jgi:hypothetical protein
MLRNERHVLGSRLSFVTTMRLLSKQQGPGRLHRVEHRGWVTMRHSWMEVESTLPRPADGAIQAIARAGLVLPFLRLWKHRSQPAGTYHLDRSTANGLPFRNTWRCHTQIKIIGMIELVLVSRSPK